MFVFYVDSAPLWFSDLKGGVSSYTQLVLPELDSQPWENEGFVLCLTTTQNKNVHCLVFLPNKIFLPKNSEVKEMRDVNLKPCYQRKVL